MLITEQSVDGRQLPARSKRLCAPWCACALPNMPANSHSRFSRIGLRTFLLLCSFVGIGTGAVSSWVATVAQVYQNVRWLDQHGVQVHSDFKDLVGLFPPDRKGNYWDLMEWSVSSPIDICAGITGSMELHEGLERVGHLHTIRFLNLGDTPVSTGDLSVLSNLPYLEEINLAKTAVDDSIFRVLRPLSHLRTLDLSQTAISDAAVGEIARMESLETITLRKTKVSPEGVLVLRRARPDLVVNYDRMTKRIKRKNCRVTPRESVAWRGVDPGGLCPKNPLCPKQENQS